MKRVLLIISGGIAAYKSLELIRVLRERDILVRAILTKGGSQFVTPLSVAALTEDKVYSDLWSLTDEAEMGHIELSRSADLVVVAPASADILAKMAAGIADDLATTTLLATDKPVLVAPSMNVRMWEHPATQANIEILKSRNVLVIGPAEGAMACGEYGYGRMSEPLEIAEAIHVQIGADKPLEGLTALVTSGPTHEPIDPVRYLGNRSSGRQGHAIAAALAQLGAKTTLITGPVTLAPPALVNVVRIQTAQEMLAACEAALPADIAVCAAAVADWRVETVATGKIKKNGSTPHLNLVENPDILSWLSKTNRRPELVVGFAAETENTFESATQKRLNKGCDWIVANHINPSGDVFGSHDNQVHLIMPDRSENWPLQSKNAVATRLANSIADYFKEKNRDG